MASASPRPTPWEIADELDRSLARYGDLIRAEYDALHQGMMKKAAILATSAEAALTDAHRFQRHLAVARANVEITPSESSEMQRRLRTANARVGIEMSRLGQLLAAQRTQMLEEISRFEPLNGRPGSQSAWAAEPTLVNVRT